MSPSIPHLLLFELVEVFLVGAAAAGKLNDAAARVDVEALLDRGGDETPRGPPDVRVEPDSVEELWAHEVHGLVEAGVKVLHCLVPRRAEETDATAQSGRYLKERARKILQILVAELISEVETVT